MAKICILEDEWEDVIKRYSSLTNGLQELYVYLDERVLETLGRDTRNIERVRGVVNDGLSRAGFNLENVRYGFENISEDASIYFCDGLNGQCLGLAEKLGKEKFYLNTTDSHLEGKARENGIKTIGKLLIQDIVKRLE